jgi:hypothetical protein
MEAMLFIFYFELSRLDLHVGHMIEQTNLAHELHFVGAYHGIKSIGYVGQRSTAVVGQNETGAWGVILFYVRRENFIVVVILK